MNVFVTAYEVQTGRNTSVPSGLRDKVSLFAFPLPRNLCRPPKVRRRCKIGNAGMALTML